MLNKCLLTDGAISGHLRQTAKKCLITLIKHLNQLPSLLMNKTHPILFPGSSILKKKDYVSSELYVLLYKTDPKQISQIKIIDCGSYKRSLGSRSPNLQLTDERIIRQETSDRAKAKTQAC